MCIFTVEVHKWLQGEGIAGWQRGKNEVSRNISSLEVWESRKCVWGSCWIRGGFRPCYHPQKNHNVVVSEQAELLQDSFVWSGRAGQRFSLSRSMLLCLCMVLQHKDFHQTTPEGKEKPTSQFVWLKRKDLISSWQISATSLISVFIHFLPGSVQSSSFFSVSLAHLCFCSKFTPPPPPRCSVYLLPPPLPSFALQSLPRVCDLCGGSLAHTAPRQHRFRSLCGGVRVFDAMQMSVSWYPSNAHLRATVFCPQIAGVSGAVCLSGCVCLHRKILNHVVSPMYLVPAHIS